MTRPVLGITMGDPAGVGPEIAAKALAEPEVREKARPLVIGDARVMAAAARVAHVSSGGAGDRARRRGDLRAGPDRGAGPRERRPRGFALGRVSAVCGRAAYEYIERGVRLAQEGAIAGIVTAPINKEALAAAGVRHSGHTEILAELTGTKAYAMLLMGKELRVIHVTTHVALRRVPELVTRERVARTIRLGDRAMRDLGIARPRMAVCGLNPHAGEGGLFGDEEQVAIGPAIADARARGDRRHRPLPRRHAHEPGGRGRVRLRRRHVPRSGAHPVKALGFRYDEAKKAWTGLSGVNVTVGLPILRVSVDHGTAFDRAGTGTANPESMVEAILVAAEMARSRERAAARA